MASAFNASSVTTSAGDLFNATTDAVDPVAAFQVWNDPASAQNLLVNIPGLHKSTEWFGIPPGGTAVFRGGSAGITQVQAKSASGTVTAHGGVVAKGI